MKCLCPLLLFLSVCSDFNAQDTIVKRDGTKIVAKVTEVNPTNIRYKRSDNPAGPMYTLEKELVNSVIYLNGAKDMFDTYKPPHIAPESADLTIQTAGKYYYYKSLRIFEPDMHAIVKKLKDPSLNAMVKSAENKKFIHDVGAIVSIPLFVTGLYIYGKNAPTRGRRGGLSGSSQTQQRDQKIGLSLMIGAVACELISVSFIFDRRRHNHMIVNAYNKKITLVDR